MDPGRKAALRRRARRLPAGVAGAAGYELVRKHFYSPIPDLNSLPRDVWTRESELCGVSFDIDAGLAFVQRELAPYITEYRPPPAATGNARDFYVDNGLYEMLDARTLYAMVRRFDPERILELGSGMSSLVIADARERNEPSHDSRHLIFDPFPRGDLAPALRSIAELHAISATEVPASEIEQLGDGDFLFVDTTHTVKIAGDVNRVILDILPTLAPGVIVHIHDIYLPWEYPQEFLTERRFFWAEQYLLQAFLAFNDKFEVLFGNHALLRRHPTAIKQLMASPHQLGNASGLWLHRVQP
jgi:Methyltransferase domain